MTEEHYSGPDLGTPTAGTSDETDVNLKEYGPEDWVTLVFFWALAIVVFLQFFTRYALNDPLAWTEEIARYLLTIVAFVGGGVAVRRYSHIHVEFLYIYYPRALAHFLSTLVDMIRVVFFGYAAWLCWKVTLVMGTQPMVVVDWPMSIVYGICTVGIAGMTLRAAQVALKNWRESSSVLTRVGREGRHQ